MEALEEIRFFFRESGRRYAHCYSDYAQRCRTDLGALENERLNILAAFTWLYQAEDWSSVVILMDAIGNPVDGFLCVRGYWDEAIKCGHQAVEAARRTGDESAEARLIGNLATVCYRRGDYDSARQAIEISLNLRQKQGDRKNVSAILHQLALITHSQGNYEEAQRLSMVSHMNLVDMIGLNGVPHESC